MANNAAPINIEELERLLTERQAKLQVLLRSREQIVKSIEDLDAQIASLALPDGRPARRRRRRPANEVPLRTVVAQVLSKSKKGLTVKEIATKVQETGYTSNSRNFRNVVYQCLYINSDFVCDEKTGLYRLAR